MIDLEPIKALQVDRQQYEEGTFLRHDADVRVADKVPALIAEVERLRDAKDYEWLLNKLDRLETKVNDALAAWWSATEPRDDGTVGYTDAIEDAMDLIWEALGTAPDPEMKPEPTSTSTGDPKS